LFVCVLGLFPAQRLFLIIITLNDLLRLFVADANALLGILPKGQINEQHSRR